MVMLLLTLGRLEVKVIVPVSPLPKFISLILGSVLAISIAQRNVPEVLSSVSEVTVTVLCPQDAEKHNRAITKVIIVLLFILYDF